MDSRGSELSLFSNDQEIYYQMASPQEHNRLLEKIVFDSVSKNENEILNVAIGVFLSSLTGFIAYKLLVSMKKISQKSNGD